jgi:hypothetical protein
MMQKQIRAAEYLRLALQASALAEGSLLENVRRKHEIAAARWTALAGLHEAA